MMDDKQFNRIAKALSDPQRFALLRRIMEAPDEVGCKALVSEFPVTQATISHHLKELTNAGLIDARKEGQCAYLRARPDVLARYTQELTRRLAPKREPAAAAKA